MPQYADILLPLMLRGCLTYHIPEPLREQIKVGQRVVVPLGKKKIYTGIVVGLSEKPNTTAETAELRDIIGIEDERPLVTTAQIAFWQWIAEYYMCTTGEVLKAALPSGLKLESETMVARNPSYIPDDDVLTSREKEVFFLLRDGEMSVEQIQNRLKSANLLPQLQHLLEIEAIVLNETLRRQYKPRTETHVRLTEEFFEQGKLNTLFDKLRKSPGQESFLLTYLDMAEASAALRLNNYKLLAEVPKTNLMKKAPGGEYALSALRKRGVLETYAYETGRIRHISAVEGLISLPLSEAQQEAYEAVSDCTKKVCLLHGVTSAGKTEIYIKLIHDTLKQGRQVLYLLPEIALTTQITTRLGRVFGNKMGVYHSKYPDNERVEVWRRQSSDNPFQIILGVRSAIFLPFSNLGLIIVDEEHEASYKQQEPAPRYHARDAAIKLAFDSDARVVLGTATPAIETYRNAKTGKYGYVALTQRYGGVTMPEILVEDVKELQRKKLMKTPFSPRLTEAIHNALEHKEEIILFHNRRGYAPVMECHTCGWTPRCSHCDVALTFHQKTNQLVCHYCGATYDVPRHCPNCEDDDLRDIGYGTEKIEAAVQSVFPNARTARMDLDTTRTRNAYEQIIRDFQQGQTDILIGTQMVTKGLDFDKVSVVGILNADQGLNQPDFRAYERTFSMLSQVAGRAGRRNKQGRVFLQTRQPENDIVRQVVENDYETMYLQQLEERQMFRYPPFVRLINIHLRHRDEKTVDTAAKMLGNMLRPHFKTDLLGPERPFVGIIRLQHLRQIMIKVDSQYSGASIRRTLLAAREAVWQQPKMKSVNIFFDVDPL